MTWSSNRSRPRRPGTSKLVGHRRIAIGLTVAFAVFGCRGENVYSTTIVPSALDVEMPVDCSEGADTYLIDVFAYQGSAGAGMVSSACQECATGEAECIPLERKCLCGGPRDFGSHSEALRDTRFEDLSPGTPLCIRLVLLRRQGGGPGPTDGPAPECGAAVTECQGDFDADQLKLCALSDLGSVGESEAPIVVREWHCPTFDEMFCGLRPRRCIDGRPEAFGITTRECARFGGEAKEL